MCKNRCTWATGKFPEYEAYHDEEWGVPVHDDQRHFEFLVLEGAQAGLSWSTVLKKREGYREVFAGFDVKRISEFNEKDIQEALLSPKIIRNQLKVRSVVNNAKAFLKVQEEFGSFDKYVWQFVGGKPIQNQWKSIGEIPATTNESDLLSKDLKKRGFKFVGSTVIYAHMQACGLVNDHTVDCFRYNEIVSNY